MAQYDVVNDNGDTVLRSHDRGRGEYRICRRPGDRLAVVEVDIDDDAHELLFAADLAVVERFLIGLLVL